VDKFNWYAFRKDLQRIRNMFEGLSVPSDLPDEYTARLVRRRIVRHQRLAETACNRELTARESVEAARVEARLALFFGSALRSFGGDPRGATLKLRAWDGCNRELSYFSTDWGGDLCFQEYPR
jgi:hypothetical protein